MLVVSSKVSSESDEKTSKLREVGHVVVEQKQLQEVDMEIRGSWNAFRGTFMHWSGNKPNEYRSGAHLMLSSEAWLVFSAKRQFKTAGHYV